MTTHLRHLKSGDALDLGPQSAKAWNEAVDAARLVERLRKSGANAIDKPPAFGSQTLVRIRNASGVDVDRFGILGITDSVLDPTYSLNEWKCKIVFEGDTPATPDHYGKFVILAQPLKNGQIGWGFVSGICVVQVDYTYNDSPYADIKNGDDGVLLADEGGAAQVLWSEGGTESQWSIVRLGRPVYPTIRGKLDGDLNSGSSATMSVWAGATLADTSRNVTLYDSSTLPFISSGKKIASGTAVTASFTAGKWYLDTPAACEVDQ
jgi:hypothetical protein